MEELSRIVSIIALTMGVGWASGINLYAALLMLGILGASGSMELPPALQVVEHPLVIFAAGFMYLVEFVADKTPGVDSAWDSLHAFIRIPAGAALAAAAVGEVDPAVKVAAALVGGGLAAASHAAKAGTRLVVNTSPEPFSNIGASLAEDVVVIAGLWAALAHPWIFLIFLALFIAMLIWLLPVLWRAVKNLFATLARLFRRRDEPLRMLPPPEQGRGPD